MATKEDVLHALLALDSYNRHESDDNRKMSNEDKSQIGTQIGGVTFQQSSDVLEDAGVEPLSGSQAAGFSASYYTIGSAKLISYRGTDFPSSLTDPGAVFEFLKDFGTGWLTSFNAIGPEGVEIAGLEYNFQPYYAQQFYEVVSGAKVFPTLAEGEQPTDITLVGHSLGGSLAGYIGSLTGNNTRIFNEIPYVGMALNTALDNFINQNVHNGVAALIQALEKIEDGLAPGSAAFCSPAFERE